MYFESHIKKLRQRLESKLDPNSFKDAVELYKSRAKVRATNYIRMETLIVLNPLLHLKAV